MKNQNDYIARQQALRAEREANGYYTPDQVADREAAATKRAEYNRRIMGGSCKHVDYRDTLDGAVCNDCGMEA